MASTVEKLEKFEWILNELEKHNIIITGISDSMVHLKHKPSERTLGHNVLTWHEFPKEEVVKMILTWSERK